MPQNILKKDIKKLLQKLMLSGPLRPFYLIKNQKDIRIYSKSSRKHDDVTRIRGTRKV